MRNTLSPILADLYMDECIKTHMSEINIPGKLWRSVDDILLITTMEKDKLRAYVKDLNSIRSKIRLTSEYEK